MNEKLEDLVAAYLDGTLEDAEGFVRDLRENPELRRYLLLAAHADVALHDLGRARPARSRRPLWIAAAAAAVLLAAWLAWPSSSGLIEGEVSWADGTRLRTAPGTVLRSGDPLVLERGSFSAEVAPRERAFVVRTPDAEIRVLGTVLRVSAGPTRLEVAEGKVALKRLSDGMSVEVGAGSFALLDLVPRPLGHVASPEGTSSGDGGFERPWDLPTALSAPLRPGETLWLRGGTYRGAFRSALRGDEKAPIVVRGLPGERATLDGGLAAFGAWTTFRDFEIANSDPDRRPGRPEGLSLLGRGHKAINLIVHDTGGAGIGFREAVGDGGEVYGCLLWGNGVYDAAGKPYGSGISAQNAGGRRFIRDTIAFRNFQSGLFIFAEKGQAVGFQLEGNVAFDHPEWSVVATGGEHPLRDFRMSENLVYGRGVTSAVRVGLVPGGRTEDVAVLDNTFVLGVGDEAFHVYHAENARVSGNTIVGRDVLARWTPAASGVREWNRNAYYATVGPGRFLLPAGRRTWEEWTSSTGFDADSTLSAAPPGRTSVAVRPNRYEEGRAHVTVLNWERRASVAADLSAVLKPGQAYVVRDAQNYYGPPAVRGVYDGKPVPLPMGLTEIARPAGGCPHLEGLLRPTGPEFAVFVVSAE
jgi:hypothetical protein